MFTIGYDIKIVSHKNIIGAQKFIAINATTSSKIRK
jgi:hypothetical protein